MAEDKCVCYLRSSQSFNRELVVRVWEGWRRKQLMLASKCLHSPSELLSGDDPCSASPTSFYVIPPALTPTGPTPRLLSYPFQPQNIHPALFLACFWTLSPIEFTLYGSCRAYFGSSLLHEGSPSSWICSWISPLLVSPPHQHSLTDFRKPRTFDATVIV